MLQVVKPVLDGLPKESIQPKQALLTLHGVHGVSDRVVLSTGTPHPTYPIGEAAGWLGAGTCIYIYIHIHIYIYIFFFYILYIIDM